MKESKAGTSQGEVSRAAHDKEDEMWWLVELGSGIIISIRES